MPRVSVAEVNASSGEWAVLSSPPCTVDLLTGSSTTWPGVTLSWSTTNPVLQFETQVAGAGQEAPASPYDASGWYITDDHLLDSAWAPATTGIPPDPLSTCGSPSCASGGVASAIAFEVSAGSYTLTVAITGTGSVVSVPPGISCPSTCSANFASGTTITLTASAGAESIFSGWSGAGCSGVGICTITLTSTESVSATFSAVQTVPSEPQIWVDALELTCLWVTSDGPCYNGPNGKSPALTVPYIAPGYEFALGSSTWIQGGPSGPSGCSFSLPYALTVAGWQAAITAIEACRTAKSGAAGFILDVPSGTYSANQGIVIPQTATSYATSPIVIRSTLDTSIAALPEPVCAGGIQDNIPEATNIGLNNSDCTGGNMYYENGPQNPCTTTCATTGTITGIVTISVNTTGLANITASFGAQLLPLANGYVSPVLAPGAGCLTVYASGSSGTSECVTPVSGVNQTGLYGIFSMSHTMPFSVVYIPNSGAGAGSFTLANGKTTNISAYNYLQYMPQLQCSASGCIPFSLCGADPGASNPCGNGNNSAGTSIAPDHWQFEDLAVKCWE